MVRYTVIIDGGPGEYGVSFPDCPGCTAMGETVEQALENAAEALRDWMADYTAKGATPPAPTPPEKVWFGEDVEAIQAAGGQIILAAVGLVRSTGRPVRPNLTLDEGVVRSIDAEAARRKVTRSGMVELMAREFLEHA